MLRAPRIEFENATYQTNPPVCENPGRRMAYGRKEMETVKKCRLIPKYIILQMKALIPI